MSSVQSAQDLVVRGEQIERVYASFAEKKYLVNRRYQRKLIWTLEEKSKFIDSIARGYPVPIILLAESRDQAGSRYEIIDGMQRLNAVTSFIENDYAVDGKYFDLNTTAVTKQLLDSGALVQKSPMLERDVCVRIAGYPLPLSIYDFVGESNVDDVFRRINSGGRKLSRQELRTAGATGHFATAVRKISAKIRGDDSFSDILGLNEMRKISITNRDLEYGIDVEKIFWVAHGILTKVQVRESRDEELVTDILAYMVSDTPPASRTEYWDDYFSIGEDKGSAERFNEIESAVQRRTSALLIEDFQRTLDQLRLTLDDSGRSFNALLFPNDSLERTPRYFQVVFLAFHELIVKKNMEVSNRQELIKLMGDSGKDIAVQDGGRWGAEQRNNAVNSYVGRIQKYFIESKNADPAKVHWIGQLQNILTQSYTEQNSYDFKQGFLTLDHSNKLDEESFEKILKTCTAIANISQKSHGYVLVGVIDQKGTADRVRTLFGCEPRPFERFYISGVEHEAGKLGKTLDELFQMVVNKVKTSAISPDLRDYVSRNLKLIRYYDKSVFVFEVAAQTDPSSYKNEFYVRIGNQLEKVAPDALASFMRRYLLS